MKFYLTYFLAVVFLNISIAQTKIYESKISETQCVRITITKTAGNAIVHYDNIPFNASLKSSIFNEVGATVSGNSLKTPSQGSYWIVPFDGTTAIVTGGGLCWNWDCECNSSGGDEGGCQVDKYYGGACISCSSNNYGNCQCCSLEAWLEDCDIPHVPGSPNSPRIKGGFVLIQANTLTVN